MIATLFGLALVVLGILFVVEILLPPRDKFISASMGLFPLMLGVAWIVWG